jgi:hypothetical protein
MAARQKAVIQIQTPILRLEVPRRRLGVPVDGERENTIQAPELERHQKGDQASR